MARVHVILCLAAAAALSAGGASAKPRKKKKEPPVAAPAAAPAPIPVAPPPPAHPTLASLLARPEAEVKARLGVPDIARREAQSAMWTYAWTDCALMVFFKSPDGRTLQVSGASAGPRRRGQATPSVDACLASNHDRPRPSSDTEAIDALLAEPG